MFRLLPWSTALLLFKYAELDCKFPLHEGCVSAFNNPRVRGGFQLQRDQAACKKRKVIKARNYVSCCYFIIAIANRTICCLTSWQSGFIYHVGAPLCMKILLIYLNDFFVDVNVTHFFLLFYLQVRLKGKKGWYLMWCCGEYSLYYIDPSPPSRKKWASCSQNVN